MEGGAETSMHFCRFNSLLMLIGKCGFIKLATFLPTYTVLYSLYFLEKLNQHIAMSYPARVKAFLGQY